MGIRQRPQAECVGVLIHVNDDELAQLDLRELGYDRVLIPIDQVQELQEPSMMPLQANIWVYVQQSPQAVSKESPIAQSYVDIILRGCFSISEDFARDFLKTTRGWHLYDHDDNENDDKGPREGNEHSVHWVDDRENPLYVRADKEYSQANAHYLDRILKEHRPEWIHRRRM